MRRGRRARARHAHTCSEWLKSESTKESKKASWISMANFILILGPLISLFEYLNHFSSINLALIFQFSSARGTNFAR